MGWLQADVVMPVSVTNILRRLAAGALLLALLLLSNVHPASAHGAGHHHTAAQNAGQLVMTDQHRSGHPASGHGCDGCPDCCAMGQCSIASVALPGGPAVAMRLTRQSAVYGGFAARDAAGLGAAPATPPPKQDA